MKLDRFLRLEASLDEHSERFEDGHRSRTVIVRPGCWEEWKSIVDGILVCTDDDVRHFDGKVLWGPSARRLEPSDHAVLGERVGKRRERYMNAGRRVCDNLPRGEKAKPRPGDTELEPTSSSLS
jgi:hypothetical protein